MRHPLVVLSLWLALTLALPGFIAAQDATPPAEVAAAPLARTNIRYVSPFTPDGLNPALNVTATEEAVCGFESADALNRGDAWDCISASDQIFDPCFENPFVAPDGPVEVACFSSPFSTDVVLLTVTEPLTRQKEASAMARGTDLAPWALPWALELGNGEQCTLFGGTLTVIAGQVAHYGCTGGGMVLGETDRDEPVWVVSYLPEGDYMTTLVEVATAWS